MGEGDGEGEGEGRRGVVVSSSKKPLKESKKRNFCFRSKHLFSFQSLHLEDV